MVRVSKSRRSEEFGNRRNSESCSRQSASHFPRLSLSEYRAHCDTCLHLNRVPAAVAVHFWAANRGWHASWTPGMVLVASGMLWGAAGTVWGLCRHNHRSGHDDLRDESRHLSLRTKALRACASRRSVVAAPSENTCGRRCWHQHCRRVRTSNLNPFIQLVLMLPQRIPTCGLHAVWLVSSFLNKSPALGGTEEVLHQEYVRTSPSTEVTPTKPHHSHSHGSGPGPHELQTRI